MCGACAFADTCASHSGKWVGRRSLSQLAHDAEQKLTAAVAIDKDGDLDPCALYDAMYAKHFGRKPHVPSKDKLKNVRTMQGVERFCAERNLDLPMFVSANMKALKPFLETKYVRGRLLRFQPNMLLGEKALARYNEAVRVGSAKGNATESSVRGVLDNMRQELLMGEQDVGEYFVASAVRGTSCTWHDAARAADPPELWWAFNDGVHATMPSQRNLWCKVAVSFDKTLLDALRGAYRLAAAGAVADTYATALADRIAFNGEFSWQLLAELLADMYGGRLPFAPTRQVPSIGELKWAKTA